MTPTKRGSNSEMTALQVDVGVILSQQETQNNRLQRIEQKIDNMSNVSIVDFEKYKDYAEKKFATKEEVGPFKRIGNALVFGVLTMLISIILWLFQGAIK